MRNINIRRKPVILFRATKFCFYSVFDRSKRIVSKPRIDSLELFLPGKSMNSELIYFMN